VVGSVSNDLKEYQDEATTMTPCKSVFRLEMITSTTSCVVTCDSSLSLVFYAVVDFPEVLEEALEQVDAVDQVHRTHDLPATVKTTNSIRK